MNPREIAAILEPEQKQVLLWLGRGTTWKSYYQNLNLMNTLLTMRVDLWRETIPWFLCATPLGLEVRAILEKRNEQ
jgi:hypothetical protein